jgi:hypothetical protein
MGDSQLSQQLDGVQENVIECMNIAADVMDLLADGKESDPSFKASCERFLERVAASQVPQPAAVMFQVSPFTIEMQTNAPSKYNKHAQHIRDTPFS